MIMCTMSATDLPALRWLTMYRKRLVEAWNGLKCGRAKYGMVMTLGSMSAIFRRVTVADFEYEVATGGLPNVLCMVAFVLDAHLQHVRTVRWWRGDFGSKPAPGSVRRRPSVLETGHQQEERRLGRVSHQADRV
jgi:hypothetical protein